MDSSDVIEDSFDSDKSILDSTADGSFNADGSLERQIVEESLMSNRPSLLSPNLSNRESLNKAAHSSRYSDSRHSKSLRKMSSSSDDESFGAIVRSARTDKRRVRTIASDSEDDVELQDVHPASTSFTTRRQTVDSDEDSEDSAASFRDVSKNSNIDVRVNSSSEEEPDASELNDTETNRSARTDKRRMRTIASDSEDDVELQDVHPASTSFTSRRQTVDSDEDSEDSAASFRDVSENSNIDVRVDASELNDTETNISNTSSTNRSPKQMSSAHKIKEEIEEDDIVDASDTEIENSSAENNIEGAESVCIVEKTTEVIDVSSSDECSKENINVDSMKNKLSSTLKQVTLDSIVQNLSLKENTSANIVAGDTLYCTTLEYSNQAKLVANLRTDLMKCKNTLRTLNLDALPDKGALLKKRLTSLEGNLATEDKKLSKMVVETPDIKEKRPTLTWDQLQANSNAVVPRTFGQQAVNTFTTQKALTMDRLQNLHTSLATCPSEDTLADDPKGLRVELMRHQKRALAWLTWRESQKPPGGILADDMGLGKTLTMIALVLKTNQMAAKEESENSEDSESDTEEKSDGWKSKGRNELVPGGTLVICPATLLRQWEGEVEKRCKRNLLSVEVYHGVRREGKATRLAKHDMVITTYKLAMGEYEKKGPLFRIKWKRIILDEAHVVRNHKAQTSLAVCGLSGKSRWALSGTPVHNKELDLYALLKFLRCSPFDDLHVWKRWVANKNAGGQGRLNTVMTSIMLRRTKEQLQAEGGLQGLPEKKHELIQVTLDSSEKQIYQKVLIFSKTLFTQFLHQREAKNNDLEYTMGNPVTFMQTTNVDSNYISTYKKVLKMHGSQEIKSHEILVLLLRLRQICCHPSLIVNMLDKDNCIEEGIEDDGVDMDILDKLNNLNLDEDEPADQQNTDHPELRDNFNTAASRLLNASNPVFAKERPNEKIRVIQKIIEQKVIPQGDKMIIVSQWTSMLQIVLAHLKQAKFNCEILDGKVPVPKRNEIVMRFNDPRDKTNILLLSLTAGGVGLNLVGANHLILLDLHWNPQLESQAQDRIYRVGQKKVVHIYKMVTADTIEERIKALQENKLAMATDILSGTRPGAGSKLTLNDLKMLFNVDV